MHEKKEESQQRGKDIHSSFTILYVVLGEQSAHTISLSHWSLPIIMWQL